MMDKLGDDLKTIFLAGVGAVATTAEKSGEVIDRLVQKGQLTVEQGKVLNEELKHNVKKAKDTASADAIAKRMENMSAEELEVLQKKLSDLQQKEG